jgi:hypothetical protein
VQLSEISVTAVGEYVCYTAVHVKCCLVTCVKGVPENVKCVPDGDECRFSERIMCPLHKSACNTFIEACI